MKPEVKPLSFWRRRLIFIFLFLAFVVCLPVFIFYATGYRYDFWGDKPTITATGGVYISSDLPEASLYIDEGEVNNARVFRQASYIQGMIPGIHRIHVQAPGYHTWVKELKVYPHIVTEVSVFNLPLIPQVRPITKSINSKGEPVLRATSSVTLFLQKSSSTIPVFISTSTKSAVTEKENSEYVFLQNLFAEKSSTTAMLKAAKAKQNSFGFGTSSKLSQAEVRATTTIEKNDLTLYERAGEVFVKNLGGSRDTPVYFCLEEERSATTSNLSVKEFLDELATNTDNNLDELSILEPKNSSCDKEIQIDRKGEEVIAFDFFPDNDNLVLMQLTNGLYVVEIDNRSWQNTQPLYLGEKISFIISSGRIYVKEAEVIFEVFPTIAIVS